MHLLYLLLGECAVCKYAAEQATRELRTRDVAERTVYVYLLAIGRSYLMYAILIITWGTACDRLLIVVRIRIRIRRVDKQLCATY